ncbi:hypothetical protein PMIN06_009895 [Paraphaeosphaeria minitans]
MYVISSVHSKDNELWTSPGGFIFYKCQRTIISCDDRLIYPEEAKANNVRKYMVKAEAAVATAEEQICRGRHIAVGNTASDAPPFYTSLLKHKSKYKGRTSPNYTERF